MRYELLKISIQGILSSDRLMDGIYNTSKDQYIKNCGVLIILKMLKNININYSA